jgi:hypothetical protein
LYGLDYQLGQLLVSTVAFKATWLLF